MFKKKGCQFWTNRVLLILTDSRGGAKGPKDASASLSWTTLSAISVFFWEIDGPGRLTTGSRAIDVCTKTTNAQPRPLVQSARPSGRATPGVAAWGPKWACASPGGRGRYEPSTNPRRPRRMAKPKAKAIVTCRLPRLRGEYQQS